MTLPGVPAGIPGRSLTATTRSLRRSNSGLASFFGIGPVNLVPDRSAGPNRAVNRPRPAPLQSGPLPAAVSKRAQLLYARPLSALSERVAPKRRFVIVCLPRTGSQLLVSLLASHPVIRCDGEVLKSRHTRVSPEVFLASRSVLARRRRGCRAYGFKGLIVDL